MDCRRTLTRPWRCWECESGLSLSCTSTPGISLRRIFTDFIKTHGLYGLISSFRNLTTEHLAVSSSLATETASIESELQQVRRALGDLDTKLNGIKDDPAIKETATEIASTTADVSSAMRDLLWLSSGMRLAVCIIADMVTLGWCDTVYYPREGVG